MSDLARYYNVYATGAHDTEASMQPYRDCLKSESTNSVVEYVAPRVDNLLEMEKRLAQDIENWINNKRAFEHSENDGVFFV